jgi:membrane protease subunit HflK
MSDAHEHEHHHPAGPPPESQDAGAQALAEAFRSSFRVVQVVMVLMVLAFFASGFFTVGPAEKAIILRFGKTVGQGEHALLGSGLHWSMPYPIDEVVKIPITQIQKVTSNNGWYYLSHDQELVEASGGDIGMAGPSLNPTIDGFMLTADTNVIHLKATLSYHIKDPIRAILGFAGGTNFAYGMTGISNAVVNVLDNALLYTAARFKVDDILTRDVEGFREAVQLRVTDMVQQENFGIVVDQCEIQQSAPRQLKDVFSQVTIAIQNRANTLVNANTYTNKVLSEASSKAATIINQAELASANYVTNVLAEAHRFDYVLPQYTENPELFEQQAFMLTLAQVLKTSEKWVEPNSAAGEPTELRLQLNREPPAENPLLANPTP